MTSTRPHSWTTTALTCATVVAASVSLVGWLARRRIERLEASQVVLRERCAQERKGRIAAEIQLRQSAQQTAKLEGYAFRQIGVCRSMFRERRGTPRQGSLAPGSLGVIELDKSVVPDASLEDLESFSHLWVLFVFHENTNEHKKQQSTFVAKVRPPLLGGRKTGVFACRTPHRPNPIGLSLVKLEGIQYANRKEGRPKTRIYISGLDLIDKTPVLDVKPFVFGDCVSPPVSDAFRVPDWITSEADVETVDVDTSLANVLPNKTKLVVEYAPAARAALKEQFKRRSRADKDAFFFQTEEQARSVISEVISLDIRAVHQGRGCTLKQSDEAQMYEVWVGDVHVEFVIDNERETATVVRAQVKLG